MRSSTAEPRLPPRPRPQLEAGHGREERLRPEEGRCRDNPTLAEGGEEEEGAGAAEEARVIGEVAGDEGGPVEASEVTTAGMRVTPALGLSLRRRRLSAATVGWRR